MQVEGEGHVEGHHTGGRLSIFNTAKRANTIENATKNVFGRRYPIYVHVSSVLESVDLKLPY